MKYFSYFFLLLTACTTSPDLGPRTDEPPTPAPAPDEVFRYNPNRDSTAVALAAQVAEAYGGQDAYDDTRYFKWNFFGVRSLTWDKQGQRARIEVPGKNEIYLLDYSTKPYTGKVRLGDREITQSDSLQQYLTSAYSMLINDNYWLVQPFKLLDPGVRLAMARDAPATDPLKNRPSRAIDFTFENVGDTPGNRYRLFIDEETSEINTWQFFREAGDTEPAMQTPYDGVERYGALRLSGDRGGRFQLSEIALPETVGEGVFTEF